MTKYRGISLVEIMLSLFLASLLMTVLMQQYLASKRQYGHIQISLDRALELQLVTDLIRDSVRRAGFTPCIGIRYLQSIDKREGQRKLVAVETGAGNHQALRINRMIEHFTTIKAFPSTNILLVRTGEHYEKGQAVLIADCYHAEVQQILYVHKTANGTLITLKTPLAFNYMAPIHLGEWIEEEFFIQKNNQGHLALFYQRNHAEELTNLVKKMSSSLKSNQGRTFVGVNLGLDNTQNLLIETEVRAG